MSNIVDVMTAFTSEIQTALPDYDQLSDSLDKSDNTSLFLDKGFACAYGPASNVTIEFCNTMQTLDRNFTVMLSNVYAPNLDADYRRTLENGLMNDQWVLRQKIMGDFTLGGVAIDARFDGDTGIEYLESDTKQFIIIMSNFVIKYREKR